MRATVEAETTYKCGTFQVVELTTSCQPCSHSDGPRMFTLERYSQV